MIHLGFFRKTKLLLAFEYGVNLSETAKNMGVELTPEIVNRMEEIITKEFSTKSTERVALDMVPNILAAFQTN